MDALYFPYLSLPSATWVNPCLLFFDKLGVITPDGAGPELFDHRTLELMDLDLVGGVVTRFGRHGREDDEKFLAFIMGRAAGMPRSDQIERVHIGKLAYTHIADELIRSGLLHLVDGMWLEGPRWVVAHVMAYLALQTVAHAGEPLSLVTDATAGTTAVRGSVDQARNSRQLRAVMKLLPVPPNAPPREIRRFKEQHLAELQRFREYIDTLIMGSEYSPSGENDFEYSLSEARRLRDHLEQEVQGFEWRAHAPSVTLGIAGTAAPMIEGALYSAGAGLLGLGLAGIAAGRAALRRRASRRHPLMYSTRVVGKWKPPRSGLW